MEAKEQKAAAVELSNAFWMWVNAALLVGGTTLAVLAFGWMGGLGLSLLASYVKRKAPLPTTAAIAAAIAAKMWDRPVPGHHRDTE